MTTATTPSKSVTPPARFPEIQPADQARRILIEAIDFGPNIRTAASISKDAVASLAKQFADGMRLINPITVEATKGDRYILVCGQLRVLAARAAGWKEIDARVLAGGLTAEQRIELQVSENLQRESFGLVAEARLVRGEYAAECAKLKHVADTGVSKPALEAVAHRFGQSSAWCQKRLRISRLSDKVLTLVEAGRVTTGQALLIAQVADPRHQEDLAKTCEKGWYMGSAYPLDDLAVEVNEVRCSLAQASWSLTERQPDLGFTPPAPDCASCPHNSANDPDLFAQVQDLEGADAMNNDSQCRLPKCYDAKAKWAEKRTAAAVATAAKALKNQPDQSKLKKPSQVVKAVEDVLLSDDHAAKLDGLKHEVVMQAVGKAVSEPKADAKTKSGGTDQYDYDAANRRWKQQQEQRRKLESARTAWIKKVADDAAAAIAKQPGTMVGLALLYLSSVGTTELRRYTKTQRESAKLRKAQAEVIRLAINGPDDSLPELAAQLLPLKDILEDVLTEWSHAARDLVLHELGISAPPMPTARDLAKKNLPQGQPTQAAKVAKKTKKGGRI